MYSTNYQQAVANLQVVEANLNKSKKDSYRFYVRNSQGNMIPLNSLVTTKVVESPSLISQTIIK